MTLSEKIQIFSTASTLIISIISVTIAILTLKRNSKVVKESNRAYIVFFIKKTSNYRNSYSLNIKNFGKTGGKLISINITPELSYSKTKIQLNKPILTEVENIYIAPNQCISSYFPFENYPDKKFDVIIKYQTLGEIITESYCLNMEYTSTIITARTEINNSQEALENINESILEVSDKLN